MTTGPTPSRLPALVAGAGLALCCWSFSAAGAARAAAAPTAQLPYRLSVFARSADGYSQPDSIAQWQTKVLIGYQNHAAKDGSDGKSSTIVQYSASGSVERTFSVPGHNDGLRVVGDNDLWCLLNEDANPNLVIIDLSTGRQRQLVFAPTVHGGGFDDMVVVRGQVFVTASNPNLDTHNVNVFPALVRATLHAGPGHRVDVTPVLLGNARTIDIPTGQTVTLNLTDPDSLAVDPRGNIVVNSQADGELVFIRNPGTPGQQVGRIQVTTAGAATTVDDTAFAPSADAFLGDDGAEFMAVFTHGKLEALEPIVEKAADAYRCLGRGVLWTRDEW
jgi:hypothetical protein